MTSTLQELYSARYTSALVPTAILLESHVVDLFQGQPRIDRITARAKAITSFLKKSENVDDRGNRKYTEPLAQIQDQIGVRIITLYVCDVQRLDTLVRKYFRAIEFKDLVPDSEWEFGYFGRHYILRLPTDVIQDDVAEMLPSFFELQLKTLFQHAWSEAEHDLGYKPGQTPLTADQKRLLAFSSAQAWGADHVFQQLIEERESGALSTSPQVIPAEE